MRSTSLVLLASLSSFLLACGSPDTTYDVLPLTSGPAPAPSSSFAPTNPSPQSQPTRPNECGGITLSTTKAPLYIAVALDRSNSMGNNGKWQAAVEGLSAFLETPHQGVSASMAFFPQVAKSCAGNYVAPTVPMTTLPSQTFRATFAQVGLLGGTPIRPALEGAASYALSVRNAAGPGARVVIGLVSDGAPSSNLCSGNTLSDVAYAATMARQNGILTYAIGMPGAVKSNLDDIAAAGGTGIGTLLDATNPGAQLTQTFDAIRNQYACEVALPNLTQDKKYEVDQVNVVFTPAGAAPVTLPYSKGCANQEGWEYDDPIAPTRILLCANACARGRAGTGAHEVKLGCSTEGDRPR